MGIVCMWRSQVELANSRVQACARFQMGAVGSWSLKAQLGTGWRLRAWTEGANKRGARPVRAHAARYTHGHLIQLASENNANHQDHVVAPN